ncbi:MAG: adenylate cyclase [Paucimonas sp.]|jgi:adenylate cyclase|nr:adenylate cyclase [Paucimonas sp.]
MGKEIERKFLVQGESWKRLAEPVLIMQGYLSSDPARTVRVRLEAEKGTLTVKGPVSGVSRGEWEYSIPAKDARELLETLCHTPLIHKHRYRIPADGLMWEIDEFFGDNAGLVVAEIELSAEDQQFELPAWLGEEVSGDPRYFNSNLLRHPYSQWQGR